MNSDLILAFLGLIGSGLIPVLGLLWLLNQKEKRQIANERKRLQTMILVAGRRRTHPH